MDWKETISIGVPSEHSSTYVVPIFDDKNGIKALWFLKEEDFRKEYIYRSLNKVQLFAIYYWTRKHYGLSSNICLFVAWIIGADYDLINKYYILRRDFGALDDRTLELL